MTELSRLFYSGRRDIGVTRPHDARAATAAEHHTMAAVLGSITGRLLRKNIPAPNADTGDDLSCNTGPRLPLQAGNATASAEARRRKQDRSSTARPIGRARIIGRLVMGRLGIVVKARGLGTGLEAVRDGGPPNESDLTGYRRGRGNHGFRDREPVPCRNQGDRLQLGWPA
jgi:hypothetical protein